MAYNVVSLEDMYEAISNEKILKEILSDFKCEQNKDVEYFIRDKSIEFLKASIAKTFLVTTAYKGKQVIVGYFSLTTKSIDIKKKYLTNSMKKRMRRFARNNEYDKYFTISVPLIGQLGKNYKNEYNKLISGDYLLKLACDKVREVQKIVGGKFVYLECEDNVYLKEFYESNGFVCFGKRNLDGDERQNNKGQYLLQMLCYL